jgi:hypothetical protein
MFGAPKVGEKEYELADVDPENYCVGPIEEDSKGE